MEGSLSALAAGNVELAKEPTPREVDTTAAVVETLRVVGEMSAQVAEKFGVVVAK